MVTSLFGIGGKIQTLVSGRYLWGRVWTNLMVIAVMVRVAGSDDGGTGNDGGWPAVVIQTTGLFTRRVCLRLSCGSLGLGIPILAISPGLASPQPGT